MKHTTATTSIEMESLLVHTEWMRRLALGLLSEPTLAEDLVQDTWVQLLGRKDPSSRVSRAWLATVLRNLARTRFRRRASRSRVEELHRKRRSSKNPSTAELVSRVESQRGLARMVLELDEPYRAVVLLRFFEDLEAKEIARQLGIPSSTVRSRLQRGLARLRERLDRQTEGEAENFLGGFVVGTSSKLGSGARSSEWRCRTLSHGSASGRVTLLRGGLGVFAVGATVLFGLWSRGLDSPEGVSDRSPLERDSISMGSPMAFPSGGRSSSALVETKNDPLGVGERDGK